MATQFLEKNKQVTQFIIFKKNGISYNTWDNWHLIPTSRPIVTQPTPVYKYVDIPGRDGPLDLTNYLTGKPSFGNRQGTFDFYVADYTTGNWANLRTKLAEVLDGSIMEVTLSDDLMHYYKGRVVFKGLTPGEHFSSVSVEYNFEPYIYANQTHNTTKIL